MLKENDLEQAAKQKKEKLRIVKNVLLISIAFMVQFTAYSGAANLQSSINAEAGLGVASLAAVYVGLTFSNLFLPAIVIKWLGTKWTMCVSFITYMPYIAAQLSPSMYTLIPAALVVGFGGGPLWCSKCLYISSSSELHSSISGVPAEALLSRFFGVFFMIFQMNQVWGNLISSLVLTSGNNTAAVTSLNSSTIAQVCGANFLPAADAGEALPPQPKEKIIMLVGIYLVCMAGAAGIVAIGVDSMKKSQSEKNKGVAIPSALGLLFSTVKLLIEPNQLLLIIINLFIGYQQAFFGADFTASFVSCAVGTGSVGFVMMTYGIADALGCIVTGYVAKYTGRLRLVCFATVVHVTLLVTILIWKPHQHAQYVLYGIAACWGIADSIWVVQINSYYGTLFPGKEEAAFANFRLWESVGFIIAYVVSPFMRTSEKTYLILSMMTLGLAGYLTVEYKERRRKKKQYDTNIEIKDQKEKGRDNFAFQNVE